MTRFRFLIALPVCAGLALSGSARAADGNPSGPAPEAATPKVAAPKVATKHHHSATPKLTTGKAGGPHALASTARPQQPVPKVSNKALTILPP